jgi:hypothetical protein
VQLGELTPQTLALDKPIKRMMQPTPNVSEADVERIVHRDFLSADRATVLAILSEYGTDDWEPERDRVRLAALKSAKGSLDELRDHVATAKRDYRDVLAAAEYPLAFERWPQWDTVSPEERQRIYDSDWEQYQRWLERP